MAHRDQTKTETSRSAKFCASLRLLGFLGLTLPLMPVQAVLLRLRSRRTWAAQFPNWYHRKVCRLLGVRLHVEGVIASDKPVLVIANHSSWLDIPVISAVAPVSFIAKSEVNRWPLVATLARLQRTVFVDRQRRTSVGRTANDILARLDDGDRMVLFAEGTSSDGNRVLPFKTSLFAAAKPSRGAGEAGSSRAVVQTLVVAYTHLHGVPLTRSDRAHLTGWYGDMELVGHAWALLQAGPLDVHVKIGPERLLDRFTDRKDLARHTENEVRALLIGMLRHGGHPSRAENSPENAGDATNGNGKSATDGAA